MAKPSDMPRKRSAAVSSAVVVYSTSTPKA